MLARELMSAPVVTTHLEAPLKDVLTIIRNPSGFRPPFYDEERCRNKSAEES